MSTLIHIMITAQRQDALQFYQHSLMFVPDTRSTRVADPETSQTMSQREATVAQQKPTPKGISKQRTRSGNSTSSTGAEIWFVLRQNVCESCSAQNSCLDFAWLPLHLVNDVAGSGRSRTRSSSSFSSDKDGSQNGDVANGLVGVVKVLGDLLFLRCLFTETYTSLFMRIPLPPPKMCAI